MVKIIDSREQNECTFQNITRGDFYINSRNNLSIKVCSGEAFDLVRKDFICVQNSEVISPVDVEINIVG